MHIRACSIWRRCEHNHVTVCGKLAKEWVALIREENKALTVTYVLWCHKLRCLVSILCEKNFNYCSKLLDSGQHPSGEWRLTGFFYTRNKHKCCLYFLKTLFLQAQPCWGTWVTMLSTPAHLYVSHTFCIE